VNTYMTANGDGEVTLAPAAGNEFFSAMPPAWQVDSLGGGVSATSGIGVIDGAQLGTTAYYSAGRSLEFVATFTGAPFQIAGFGMDFRASAVGAYLTTRFGNGLSIDTNNGVTFLSAALPRYLLGQSHRYRIDWNPSNVVLSVDGQVLLTQA